MAQKRLNLWTLGYAYTGYYSNNVWMNKHRPSSENISIHKRQAKSKFSPARKKRAHPPLPTWARKATSQQESAGTEYEGTGQRKKGRDGRKKKGKEER